MRTFAYATVAISMAAVPVQADPNLYHFSGGGERTLLCQCVLATSGCALKLFNKISGAQVHSWTQTAFGKSGLQVDLSDACFRKRAVEKAGEGLCCKLAPDDYATNARFYWGEVQD